MKGYLRISLDPDSNTGIRGIFSQGRIVDGCRSSLRKVCSCLETLNNRVLETFTIEVDSTNKKPEKVLMHLQESNH